MTGPCGVLGIPVPQRLEFPETASASRYGRLMRNEYRSHRPLSRRELRTPFPLTCIYWSVMSCRTARVATGDSQLRKITIVLRRRPPCICSSTSSTTRKSASVILLCTRYKPVPGGDMKVGRRRRFSFLHKRSRRNIPRLKPTIPVLENCRAVTTARTPLAMVINTRHILNEPGAREKSR
jgi:hypothetical protein